MAKELNNVPVVADLSTGLANTRTKPRRIPDAYLNQNVKDVINYLKRVIEKKGDAKEQFLVTDVHDQMKEQYVIKANEINVNQNTIFKKVADSVTTVEDVGEGGEGMPVRHISFIITKVEDGASLG